MLDKFWDFFIECCMTLFIPLVSLYFAICGNFFLNTSFSEATGLEKMASDLLAPFQYIFCGQIADQREDGFWVYRQRFDYSDHFWIKMGTSLVTLPPSLILGSAVKGLSLIVPENQKRYLSMKSSYFSDQIEENRPLYEKIGIALSDVEKMEWIESQKYERRPEDKNHLKREKEALREITTLLTKAGIPWWVDCGTCLGALRYGGIIPWDEDIDIAILLPDHDNLRRALTKLDPQKYMVQNWSGRESPNNYFKIFIKETKTLIDIYHFDIDPKSKTIQYLFSLETSSIFPEWWKIRERRFTIPVSFEDVFPLKKGLFDGVEVFLPNNPVKYLQRCYGENLAPAKIYNPITNQYDKDLSHPYWQRLYAH